jgi:hypothetical protein
MSFTNRKRALVVALGLAVSAQVEAEQREVVEQQAEIRMLGVEHLSRIARERL